MLGSTWSDVMAVSTQKIGKACILTLSGELKLGPSVEELNEVFRQSIDNDERHFVFNMLKVVMRGKSHDLFTFH
jgi:hypothetical protein